MCVHRLEIRLRGAPQLISSPELLGTSFRRLISREDRIWGTAYMPRGPCVELARCWEELLFCPPSGAHTRSPTSSASRVEPGAPHDLQVAMVRAIDTMAKQSDAAVLLS